MRRGAALLATWGLAAAQVDHEIHDSRSPGYNGRPPLPAPEGMVLNIDTDVVATDGVAGHTTWRISAATGGEMQNMYAIFADSNHTVVLPPAFQVPAPFGSDIGGPNPAFIAFNADVAFDSFLCVGDPNPAPGALAASPGFPVEGWAASETVALETTDGVIFYMDPFSGPASDGAMIFAQLTLADATVAAGGTATAALQGRSGGEADDWEGYSVAWAR